MISRRAIPPEAFEEEAPPITNHVEETPRRKRGRPAGVCTKTEKQLYQLLSGRINYKNDLPHEFLLRIVRGEPIRLTPEGFEGDPQYALPDLEQRMRAAKDAAPYFAPRLSAVEVIQGISDADLEQVIIGAAASAGVTVNINGANATISGTELVTQSTPHLGVRRPFREEDEVEDGEIVE